MARLFLLLLMMSGPAAAQTFPALYNVVDVASDDVLNVRVAPNASAETRGAFSHDETGIEVISVKDGWALVNLGEQSGWTFLRFLARQPASTLPERQWFQCFGTEPFWDITVKEGRRADFSELGVADPIVFSLGPMLTARARPSPFVFLGTSGDDHFTMVIEPEHCSDGMSDRTYGLSTTLVFGGSRRFALEGCCSLSVR